MPIEVLLLLFVCLKKHCKRQIGVHSRVAHKVRTTLPLKFVIKQRNNIFRPPEKLKTDIINYILKLKHCIREKYFLHSKKAPSTSNTQTMRSILLLFPIWHVLFCLIETFRLVRCQRKRRINWTLWKSALKVHGPDRAWNAKILTSEV